MNLTFFTDSVFLQSLGFTLIGSLWQTMLLWMLYKLIFFLQSKATALQRYHFGLLLLTTSLIWSFVTFFSYYSHLNLSRNGVSLQVIFFVEERYLNAVSSIFAVIYFVLALFYFFRFILDFKHSRSILTGELIKSPIEIRLFVTNTSSHLSISRKIAVWLSENVDVPSVSGFFKPIILLPVAFCNHLSTKQIEAVLLHELAHIKRNDYIINIFQKIIEAIFFYNPFLHLLSKEIRKERENCCDDFVITHQYDPYEYANALLVLEEQRALQLQFALTATSGKKQLLNRTKRLFSSQNKNNILSYRELSHNFVFAILLFSGILLSLPVKNIQQRLTQTVTEIKHPFVKVQIGYQYFNIRPYIAVINNKETRKVVNKYKSEQNTVNKAATVAKTTSSTAYINEDLLIPPVKPFEESIQLISNIESPQTKQILVKVEDEQSGKPQNQTYYLELSRKNGKTTVKPLVILKKNTVTNKKVKDSSLPAVSKKLRITS